MISCMGIYKRLNKQIRSFKPFCQQIYKTLIPKNFPAMFRLKKYIYTSISMITLQLRDIYDEKSFITLYYNKDMLQSHVLANKFKTISYHLNITVLV